MKKIILIISISLLGFTTVWGQKQLDQYQIQVDGLGCPFCAYGLEKKFKEFKELKNVAIKIETGDFSFQYPSKNHLSMAQVISQVKKAGYTPKEATIIRADGKKEVFPNTTTISNEEAIREAEIKVSGNCDMCKARIEATALSNTSVHAAQWDAASKKLTLSLSGHINVGVIGKLLANAGHDNEFEASETEAYEQLPPCCLYRK